MSFLEEVACGPFPEAELRQRVGELVGQLRLRLSTYRRLDGWLAYDLLDVAAIAARVARSVDTFGVEIACDAAAREILGDPLLVERAIHALVKNAVGACQRNHHVRVPGHVWIHTRALGADGEVEVAVRDDGVGLARETVRDLLTPSRWWSWPSPYLGMGIPIAWRVADLHGGRLEADGRPGEGCEFRLRLAPPPPSRPADT